MSQALSLLLAVTAAVMLFYNIKIKKHSRDELLVNQVAAEAAEGTAEADISTAEAGESVPAGQEEPELPSRRRPKTGKGERLMATRIDGQGAGGQGQGADGRGSEVPVPAAGPCGDPGGE